MERLAYTWSLMRASLDVLRKDKGLLLFPLLSGISCIVVMISFFIPLVMAKAGSYAPPGQHADMQAKIVYYGVLFLFYFCNYLVITFFNTAIVACAVSRMAGGEPTVAGGFREAFNRIHLIVGWALVQATVGLAIRMLVERSRKTRWLIVAVLGSTWSILTYLVVPVMVVERKGPFAAAKESTQLLKRLWGDEITGYAAWGLIFLVLALPAYVLIGASFYTFTALGRPIFLLGIAFAAVYLVLLALVQSALQSIFQAAVYLYTQDALLPPTEQGGNGFPVQLVANALK